MSESEQMKDHGCSCHTMAPCSFCTSMTEEETSIMWNEGIEGLERFWKQRRILEEYDTYNFFDHIYRSLPF